MRITSKKLVRVRPKDDVTKCNLLILILSIDDIANKIYFYNTKAS